MLAKDPHDPTPPFTYECYGCGFRREATHHPGDCPRCGTMMQDLGVARE